MSGYNDDILSRERDTEEQAHDLEEQAWAEAERRMSAIPIETQRTTALLPNLTQLARISEPRIASDQTRGVCLLCAIVFHPLDLFGRRVLPWRRWRRRSR